MKITAKARCMTRISIDDEQDRVGFSADYSDKDGNLVNAEWARFTPVFTLSMQVLKSVPFEAGKSYTLTFDDGE